MTMELRAVSDDKVLGSVDYADGDLTLTGAAEQVFGYLRESLGDQAVGEGLAENGWSNGYLYLAPEDST